MMKLLCLAISLVACSQSIPVKAKKTDIGLISKEALLELKPNWKKAFDAYKPLEQTKLIGNYEFVIITATWCHDSEREMPILFKVLESYGVKDIDIQIYLTDKKKRKPEKVIEENKVFFTPTIIVKKDGKEVKRFVENPNTYWERDIRRLQVKDAK